jgi:hypothetical protein
MRLKLPIVPLTAVTVMVSAVPSLAARRSCDPGDRWPRIVPWPPDCA